MPSAGVPVASKWAGMSGGELRQLPRSSRSLGRQVASTVRDAIVEGRLASGQRLIEEELASQLGVSRGPVRETLQQLEREGLVTSFPNRGSFVAEISVEEIVHVLIPIRETIESFALQHALPKLTDVDFKELAQIVAEMESYGEKRDLARLVDLDLSFHRLLIERSEQQHSLQVWELIAPRIRRIFYLAGPFHAALGDIASEHQTLLDVIREGDLASARDALEAHIAERSLYGELAERYKEGNRVDPGDDAELPGRAVASDGR